MSAPVPSNIDDYLSSLPEFKSEDRIESLYSDFSPARHSNPTGFEANISCWKRILTDVLRLGLQPPTTGSTHETPDRILLHLNDRLLEQLRRPRIGTPYGLFCPVWNLSSLSPSNLNPVLAPLSKFISSGGWTAQTGIAAGMIRSFSWASRSFIGGSYFDPDQRFEQLELDQKWTIVKTDWVHLSLLSDASDGIIERYQQGYVGLSPLIDCLYTYDQFKNQLATDILPVSKTSTSTTFSDTDLKLIIKHLERDRKVIISEAQIIKFVQPRLIECDPAGRRLSKVGPSPIDETDRGVLSVKQTIHQLQHQIQAIENRIDERTAEAKKYVQKSQSQLAASHLRSRKTLQDVLRRRLATLDTIQTVYMKIEQASTDVEILSAYETSTKTLQSLLSTPSLRIENIEQTMDKLNDVLADHKEIEEAIEIGNPHQHVDEGELAAELADLVASESVLESSDVMEDLGDRLDKLTVPPTPEQPDVSSNKTNQMAQPAS